MTIEAVGLQSDHDVLLILKSDPLKCALALFAVQRRRSIYLSHDFLSFRFTLLTELLKFSQKLFDHFIDCFAGILFPPHQFLSELCRLLLLSLFPGPLHFLLGYLVLDPPTLLHQISEGLFCLTLLYLTFFELPHQIIEGRLVCHFPDHEARPLLPVLPGLSPFVLQLPYSFHGLFHYFIKVPLFCLLDDLKQPWSPLL